MPDIITRCKKHGIVNSEPMPESINEESGVGQMTICPICNKRTEINYPGEVLTQVERSYGSPWSEE